MKKTLVALAAVAATSAFAQSTVSIYGLLDVGYGTTKTTSNNGTGDIKSAGVMEGTTAGNRLGFRGTEDLGGGMKASFVVEQGITLANNGAGGVFGYRVGASGHQNSTSIAAGNNAAYNGGNGSTPNNARQSFVGLSGGFGEVRVGYQYTVLYSISSLGGYLGGWEGASGSDQAHVWSAANAGVNATTGAALTGAPGITVATAAGNVGGFRANAITYMSPAFAGGFSATVQYGSGGAANLDVTTAGVTNEAKRTALQLNYANGPLKAALGYTSQKNQVNAANPTVSYTSKLTQLAGAYDFGVASVNGTYNRSSSGLTTTAANQAVGDTTSYQMGVKVPFGATAVFAAFGKAKSEDQFNGAKTADIKQFQVGATYTLSKRTSLYAVNGTTKDAVREAATTAGTAFKGSTTRLGLVHTF